MGRSKASVRSSSFLRTPPLDVLLAQHLRLKLKSGAAIHTVSYGPGRSACPTFKAKAKKWCGHGCNSRTISDSPGMACHLVVLSGFWPVTDCYNPPLWKYSQTPLDAKSKRIYVHIYVHVYILYIRNFLFGWLVICYENVVVLLALENFTLFINNSSNDTYVHA